VDARAVADLVGLLPPKPVSGPPVDLTKLSDRELGALERLVEIGSGVKPSREHKPKSSRYWASFDLVVLLDRIEARGVSSSITDEERVEVRSLICGILGTVVLPGHLWSPEMFIAPALAEPVATSEPTPLPAPTNVVALRQQQQNWDADWSVGGSGNPSSGASSVPSRNLRKPSTASSTTPTATHSPLCGQKIPTRSSLPSNEGTKC
jgi:hypothetical protein